MLGLASDRCRTLGDFPNSHRNNVEFAGTVDKSAGVESAGAAAVVDNVSDVVGFHWDGRNQERIGGEPAFAGVRTEVTVW